MDSIQMKTGKYHYSLNGEFEFEDSIVPTKFLFADHPLIRKSKLIGFQMDGRSYEFQDFGIEEITSDTLGINIRAGTGLYSIQLLKSPILED